MEQTGSSSQIWWLSIFQISVEKIKVLLESEQNNGTSHLDRTAVIIPRWILPRMNYCLLQAQIVYKIKTHFMFNHVNSPKIVPLMMWENMVEPGRPQMAIQCGDTRYILRNESYKHTFRYCNICCFLKAEIFKEQAPNYVIRTLHVLLSLCSKIGICFWNFPCFYFKKNIFT
jgi:hypothetical protein